MPLRLYTFYYTCQLAIDLTPAQPETDQLPPGLNQ